LTFYGGLIGQLESRSLQLEVLTVQLERFSVALHLELDFHATGKVKVVAQHRVEHYSVAKGANVGAQASHQTWNKPWTESLFSNREACCELELAQSRVSSSQQSTAAALKTKAKPKLSKNKGDSTLTKKWVKKVDQRKRESRFADHNPKGMTQMRRGN